MHSDKSVICKSPVTAKSGVSLTGRRRGKKSAPIVEHPEPLFTDWIEPGSFHESLALHMRRHGDTYWGLWRALVRPDEVFDRTTLQSWTAGRRAPRSAKSFEMLARIEHRYNLPKGHFRSLLPHPSRAVTGHKLVGIDPAEQRRLAWHLPDDFNNRPLRERKEIVEWVRTHIISGSTEYRRFQIEAMKHRYAIRFPAITGRKRSPKIAEPDTQADDDPEAMSTAYDAPPRLNDEMQRLITFKTTTLTEIGYQRNGVWGEETSSQKIEHFGLMFGALAAAPTGAIAGFGVPLADLTFGLLVFPTVWDWYVQWRERRRGFYTRWEVDMLRLGAALTRYYSLKDPTVRAIIHSLCLICEGQSA